MRCCIESLAWRGSGQTDCARECCTSLGAWNIVWAIMWLHIITHLSWFHLACVQLFDCRTFDVGCSISTHMVESNVWECSFLLLESCWHYCIQAECHFGVLICLGLFPMCCHSSKSLLFPLSPMRMRIAIPNLMLSFYPGWWRTLFSQSPRFLCEIFFQLLSLNTGMLH